MYSEEMTRNIAEGDANDYAREGNYPSGQNVWNNLDPYYKGQYVEKAYVETFDQAISSLRKYDETPEFERIR